MQRASLFFSDSRGSTGALTKGQTCKHLTLCPTCEPLKPPEAQEQPAPSLSLEEHTRDRVAPPGLLTQALTQFWGQLSHILPPPASVRPRAAISLSARVHARSWRRWRSLLGRAQLQSCRYKCVAFSIHGAHSGARSAASGGKNGVCIRAAPSPGWCSGRAEVSAQGTQRGQRGSSSTARKAITNLLPRHANCVENNKKKSFMKNATHPNPKSHRCAAPAPRRKSLRLPEPHTSC